MCVLDLSYIYIYDIFTLGSSEIFVVNRPFESVFDRGIAPNGVYGRYGHM